MSNLFLTGASGFVGSALLSKLLSYGHNVVTLTRSPLRLPNDSRHTSIFGDLLNLDSIDFSFLRSIDAVIHSAGRAHVMNENSMSSHTLYSDINYRATLKIARYAAQFGVKRFIFISTIKVNGEFTHIGQRFHSSDSVSPLDFYSISKYRAELALRSIACEYGMEYVVVRPPLIYGPGCKGNFALLKTLVTLRVPLPLKGINNSRSLISLDNLISFILLLADRDSSPKAKNNTFLISDSISYSTPRLVHLIAKSLSLTDPSFYFPPSLLSGLLSAIGKQQVWQRLSSSLLVDSSSCQSLLGWKPPFEFLDQQI